MVTITIYLRYINLNIIKINYNRFREKEKASNKRGFLSVPGNVLLSHASYPRSTIGAIGLNFRVRDGIGCFPYAIATGKIFGNWANSFTRIMLDKAIRLISTTRLNALLHLHL